MNNSLGCTFLCNHYFMQNCKEDKCHGDDDDDEEEEEGEREEKHAKKYFAG